MKLTSIIVACLINCLVFAQNTKPNSMNDELQTATLGSGCFWCTEAVYLRVKGVESVVSGYSGGKVKNPTYREVCTGLTGHAEVIQVKFNPKLISYEEILEIFWNTHDPTTLNRQGADEGTQYRSVIFYHNEEQRKLAEQYKNQLNKSGIFKNPIVTELTPYGTFYPAEDYHQNYYALNPNQGYCQYVIRPKVEKFNKQFASKLKK
jgi:peptide-methionine (S)-S-oxide reductase